VKTPPLTRLGFISVASALALVGAVLSPASAAGPTSPAPDMSLTKTWSGSVDNGGTATASIVVSNSGGANVHQTNVTIVDSYDPGLVYTGFTISDATGSCANDTTLGFRRVVCTGLDLAVGEDVTIDLTFTGSYWGYRTYTKNYVSDERLDVQKAETHVDIQSDDFTTKTVTCPANYDIVDYSWHLQQVDQDTGDFYDVYMVDSDINDNSATVELFNDAGGKAQGKLWALCLRNTTNHGHAVDWDARQSSTESLVPTGPYERPFFAECDKGHTPMAINLRADANGSSDVDSIYMDDLFEQTGLEADGSRRAIVWAVVKDYADFELQWRCVNTKIGTKRMYFGSKTASQVVAKHNKVAQEQITCAHGYKGVIGGWRGGHFNGSEPRPITRVYWLWYDGPEAARTFTGKLLCLKTRLMRGGKLKKTGVTDDLYNHVFGTTQNHAFYIDDFAEDWTTVTQVN